MNPCSFSLAAFSTAAALLAAFPGGRIQAAEVRTVKDVSYLEAGRSEKLDLYLPECAPDDPPSPAVVWIHGGGWTGGTKEEARAAQICGMLAAAEYSSTWL